MSDPTKKSGGSRLDDLVAEYLDRLNDGERLDPEAILLSHPDLGPVILEEVRASIRDAQHRPGHRIDLHLIHGIGSHLEYPLARAKIHPVDVIKALEFRVILRKDDLEELLVGDEALDAPGLTAERGWLNPIHFLLDQQQKPRHRRHRKDRGKDKPRPFMRVPEKLE